MPTHHDTHHDQRFSPVRKVLSTLFTLSVIVFLLGGLAIVVGQAVQLALGSASGARAWEEHLTLVAFGGASVAGLLAFLLTYGEKQPVDEDGLTEDAGADRETDEAVALAAGHPPRDAGR